MKAVSRHNNAFPKGLRFVVGLLIATSLVAVLPCAPARADLLTHHGAVAGLIPPPPMALEFVIQTDKKMYFPSETVHVTYRVSNPLETPITHEVNQSPFFGIRVVQGRETIWSSSPGAFLVHMTIGFGPGEVIEEVYSWNMVDIAGNSVPPGAYDVVGLSGSREQVRTLITIVPEPATALVLTCGVAAFGFRIRRGLRYEESGRVPQGLSSRGPF